MTVKILPPNPPTYRGTPLYIAPNGPRPITRVLIANRGEIALRIIRTCQQMGIASVALYTTPDASSEFVSCATTAIHLGDMGVPEGAKNPYLDAERLVRLAAQHGCDAIHPGYGYLSENADFADLVDARDDMVFLGPRGDVMRQIGEKSASKQLLRKAFGDQAPLVPGFEGEDFPVDRAASEIGFPIMIKASSGGGGRGMRIVRDPALLADEIVRARSEAERNFGSPTLLLERYVEGCKHIEVQIFGDRFGNVYALGERDCSVQRRHQKVIEESPAVACELDADLRQRLHQSAVDIGKLLAYHGAGTVEYIYDAATKQFFFLEVNTRLQVEHPVTEMCTGLDLVSLQLYVGAGGDLSQLSPVAQLQPWGHAIECRVCAEEPGCDFAPRTGFVRMISVPMLNQPGVRFDTGAQVASTVSVFFDSMVGKLIVHASTRAEAVRKILQVLQTSVLIGLPTNIPFMSACLRHPLFLEGSYSTSLIPQNLEALLDAPAAVARTAILGPHATATSTTSSSSKQASQLPVGVIAPIFHLFHQLRSQLYPTRAGFGSSFSLHPQSCDGLLRSTENYLISLPDGAGEWDVMVECAQDHTHGSTELRIWNNLSEKAVAAAEAHVKAKFGKGGAENDEKKKQKAEKKQQLALKAVTSSARIYGALRHRDGLEGRKDGEWQFGVKDSAVTTIRSELLDSQLTMAHPPRVPGGKAHANAEPWVTAQLTLSVDGLRSSYVLATDHTYAAHESSAQTAWVWCPPLCGAIRVTRRGVRLLAADAMAKAEKELLNGGAEVAEYVTPMPAKILQVLVQPNQAVEAGQALLICESMKIETTVRAQVSGRVALSVRPGDTVAEGQVLCRIGAREAATEDKSAAEAEGAAPPPSAKAERPAAPASASIQREL